MAPKKKIADLKKLFEERWHYPPRIKAKKIKYTACGKRVRYGDDGNLYQPCWKCPLSREPNVKFGPCWDYPPERYRRRPLPPPCRGAVVPNLPSFEHCESLYTRFDFELERCVHEHILVIQQKFFNLEQELSKAKEFQIQMAEQMRYHAMRYQLLTRSIRCIKVYPEYLSKMAEERALCEFQRSYDAINESNNELGSYILDIQDSMPELQTRLEKLDRTLHSPFLVELVTVLEIIDNLSNYFFGVASKLKVWAQLIDPGDEHSIEDYLGLLKVEQDFNSLMKAGTEKCTCKRCEKKNPLLPFIPHWCQPHGCVEPVKKPLKDYLCNVAITARPETTDSENIDEPSSTSKFQAHQKEDSVSSTKS